MYDRKNEFDHFFEEVHLEQEKNDISRIAKTVKRKARVHTAMISIRNFVFAMVFLSSITVIGVNTSPTIARTLAKIPIIGDWIEGAAEDEGIQEALKNDCETVVNQTRKVQGGSVTLSYCIADESNFVFSVSGDFADDKKGTLNDIQIENLDLGEVNDNYSYTSSAFGTKENPSCLYVIDDWLLMEDTEQKWEFPKKIRLTATANTFDKQTQKYVEEIVSFDIALKKPQPPKAYKVNQTVTLKGQKITIHKVLMYPTCTNIYYSMDEKNTMDAQVEFLLKSKKGVELSGKQMTYYPEEENGEILTVIKSGFYLMGDDFELILSEAELLSKDRKDIKWNTKTNKFYDAYGEINQLFVPDQEDPVYGEIYKELSEEDSIPVVVDMEKTKMISTLSFQEDYPDIDDVFISTTITETEQSEKKVLYAEIPQAVIQADKDGIVHLEREFPEYFLSPNLSIKVK